MTVNVVQTSQNGSTAATCTVTLSNQTTAGNCLVVWSGTSNATTNATVSGITLGGSAGNFGSLLSVGTSGGNSISSFWADPNCTGSQTSVVVTTTGGVGAGQLNVTVLEVFGLFPTLAALLDQSVSTNQTSALSSWTSGTTPNTTSPLELWVGGVTIAANEVITGPATGGWSNLTQLSNTTLCQSMVGYQVVATQGTVTYAGTMSGTSGSTAAAIALFGLPPAAPLSPRPVNRVVTVPFFSGITGAQHSR